MSPPAGRVATLALAALLAGALFLPPAAQASFGFLAGSEGFSVAAENEDHTPTIQAGAHPAVFSIHVGLRSAGGQSDGDLRDLRIGLPPGFLINPTARAEGSQVGVVTVELGNGANGEFGLLNLAPPFGTMLALGAQPFGRSLVFAAKLREGDAGFDLDLEGLSKGLDLVGMQISIWGTNPTSAYLTMPTSPCGSPLPFSVGASSWQGAEAEASATTPALVACNKPLSSAKVQLMSDQAAARTGLAFNLAVNDGGGILNPAGIARPAIKQALLSLPEGLTINPSLGAGLGVCTEADFARETAGSEPGAGCPNDSRIGTVTLEGALGLAEPLSGAVYVAKPYQNPFGTLLALYMTARSPRRGLLVKSIGKIEPDLRTGRLKATFDDLPRLLYRHFALTLREGQRSTLISPPLCGSYSAGLDLSSWAEPDLFRHEASVFAINHGEGGGPCPAGGVPPFHPGLLAGSINPAPATYTPLYLRMSRTDAEQEITGYSAAFPPGLLAKVAGVPYCPEAAIEAAKHRSGAAEQASPSCPAGAQIGHTLAGYGVGGTLAYAPGNLYLAGPWHGAPLSVVAIDAALIGPFDLGTVVVRDAIRVDTATARVAADGAASDPIPHILAGIPLHVRDIRIYIDRPNFTLNPTSCDPAQILSTLSGAGADLISPADDWLADSTQRFGLIGCSALGFKPKLSLSLKGGTRRGAYPSLRATYTPRPGDANLRGAAVTLPPSLFLAQEHLHSICTRAQFARQACPADSVYGYARAITPLLDQPLQGPVYVRSSSNAVPDLVADLRGEGLATTLIGRIDSSRGGLRAHFEALPDAPISKFTMTLPGGRKSLLVNAEDLCAAGGRATARFIGQNNATEVLHPRLGVRCHRERGHRGAKAKSSEALQQGNLRVSFGAKLSPQALPRRGVAPVAIGLAGEIGTADGSEPPALQRLQIAVNRHGHLDTKGLPVCRLDQIQPATNENALAACGGAKVGEGSFSAAVLIPEQSPFPSRGKIIAFNGIQDGHPVIFAHVYGTEPIPTSFTLALRISRAKGLYGTLLAASLPGVASDAAVVTGLTLNLHRRFFYRGQSRSYLSAGCPAPQGFPGALFPLARARFTFEGGKTLSKTLTRSCRVRGSG